LQRHLVHHVAGGLMARQDCTGLLRSARLACASPTVLAVVAPLGVFAATVGSSVTRHTTVVRQVAATPLAAESLLATTHALLATDAANTQTKSCLVDLKATLTQVPTTG
jgi:hypothetical protein